MFFLLALAVLTGLVAFASFVWLLVVAFRTHVGWGLAVLFLPLAPIVFAVKYWQDSKRPFLLNLGSSVACLVLFFAAGGLAFMTAAEMAAETSQIEIPSYDLDAASQAGVEIARQAAPAEPEDAAEPVDQPERSVPSLEAIEATIAASSAHRPRRVRGEIEVDEIDESHIGNALRVVTQNGANAVAVLTAVSPDGLTFSREVAGGTIEFVLRRDEIESVEAIQ